jgi:DNA-binding PadR family transcriptional regulator
MSALEHCLLGLIEHGDCSGYDLRKVLTSTPMRHYSDSPGSIYPALERMQRRGWITAARDRQSRRRRSVYGLTERGKRELRRWLEQPVTEAEVADRLNEVMLRLAFQHLRGDASTRRFVTQLAAAAGNCAASLEEFIHSSAQDYPIGARLALQTGLQQLRAVAECAAAESRRSATQGAKPKSRSNSRRRKSR